MPASKERREHEEAATRLNDNLDRILQIWSHHARKSVPAARDLDPETLVNNLRQLLKEIASVLVTSRRKDAYAYAKIPTAKEHAQQRGHLETYSLDQVILEYHLLRKAVVEVMEEGHDLSQDVASVIHDGIDRAM